MSPKISFARQRQSFPAVAAKIFDEARRLAALLKKRPTGWELACPGRFGSRAVEILCHYQQLWDSFSLRARTAKLALGKISAHLCGQRAVRQHQLHALAIFGQPAAGQLMVTGGTQDEGTIFAVKISPDGTIRRSDTIGTGYLVKRAELEKILAQVPGCLRGIQKKLTAEASRSKIAASTRRGFV